jgi:hypothetical protein
MEQCNVCGGWFEVETLVRQTQVRRRMAGANYLAWSRYNTAGWETTAAYQGEISLGRSTIYHQLSGDDYNITKGAGTFEGDGRLTSKTEIDASTWTTLTAQGRFGMHQEDQSAGITVAMGVLKGANEYPILTRTNVFGDKVRGTIDLSDILVADRDALKLYFDITTDWQMGQPLRLWWGHFFQVQKDVTRFDELIFVPTAGAARVYATDAKILGKTVVCRDHWERLPKQINRYRPSPDGAEVVEEETQEL